MVARYGMEHFRKLWWDYCDFYRDILVKQQGDICRSELARINCPTLIVHGEKDPMVHLSHPSYLLRHIPKAK